MKRIHDKSVDADQQIDQVWKEAKNKSGMINPVFEKNQEFLNKPRARAEDLFLKLYLKYNEDKESK